MNTTEKSKQQHSPDHPEKRSQEINFGNLIKDYTLFGPAPTPGREAVVAVVALVGLGVVFTVTQPPVVVIAIAGVLAVSLFAVRSVMVNRKWAQR